MVREIKFSSGRRVGRTMGVELQTRSATLLEKHIQTSKQRANRISSKIGSYERAETLSDAFCDCKLQQSSKAVAF